MADSRERWPNFEVRLLMALQAIAADGTFHGAAVRLGYTQSTVSEQIAKLERVVGKRLVNRPGGPRRVSLTEAGQILLRHAEVVLARLQAADADLKALAVGETGSFRVGIYQSVSRQILPPLMQEFATTLPRLAISLTESSDDADFFPLVESGELDLAFAVFPLADGPFEAVELLRDPYVLVVPADSPLAGAAVPPALREIAKLGVLTFGQPRSFEPIAAHARSQGLDLDIAFRSDDYETLEALVATGMGVALVPRLTVWRCDARVAVVPLDHAFPARRIALVWHRDRRQLPAARAFVETVQRICRTLQSRLDSRKPAH